MRVIISGGGTGGHLFPGIALATGLQQRDSNCRVMFIGTRRQLDRKTLADYDFKLAAIDCMGLKGKGPLHRIRSLLTLPGAVLEARSIITRFGPDLVFGVGGYVTGPVLLAARLQGVPTCIHEQNSVPGLANRMIARFVDRVFVSLPGTSGFPAGKIILSGNPVREEILAAAGQEKVKAEDGHHTILVLGGSQGAHRVNLLMLAAMQHLQQENGLRIRLVHQTGTADLERIKGGYEAVGIQAEVAPFFTDMASLYRRADLVVARAGATTLAELSVMGLPALLIPYPYAADDHQAKNAQYYVKGGGARMFRESELDADILAAAVTELLQSPGELHSMSQRMLAMGRPGATRRILDDCLEFSNHSL